MVKNLKRDWPYLLSAFLWLATLALWIVLVYFTPQAGPGTLTGPVVGMMFLAGAAAPLALSKVSVLILVFAAASVWPVGLYVLGSPSYFALIGVFNLVNLALGLWLTGRDLTRFAGKLIAAGKAR